MIAALLATLAAAQDADGWTPAAGFALGRGGPTVESAAFTAGEKALGLTGALARSAPDGGEGLDVAVPLTVGGGWTWGDRLRFDAFFPTYAFARRADGGAQGLAAGSMQVQALVPLTTPPGARVSVLPRVSLPTGTATLGVDRGWSAGARLALTGGRGRWGGTVNAGGTLAPRRALPDGTETGSTVDYGVVGTAQLTDAMRLGAELAGAAGIGDRTLSSLFAQVTDPTGLSLGVVASRGFGVTLDARVGATVSWHGVAAPDRDRDGVVDSADACPNDPEDLDRRADDDGCPDLDDDQDGRPDADDQCPTEAEDADGRGDADGCPDPDDDGDGVLDGDDRCPTLSGPAAQGGCPDADADGLHDGDDRCPATPRPADEIGGDGCPRDAWLTADAVRFRIAPAFDGADRLVDLAPVRTIAAVFAQQPTLRAVLAVHMSASGGDPNQALASSRLRAERLREALVSLGVSPERLEAVGYGSDRPIDTNRTAAGRARNERVEILVQRETP
jgi:hypothetical protein